jgi:hypothetical protein
MNTKPSMTLRFLEASEVFTLDEGDDAAHGARLSVQARGGQGRSPFSFRRGDVRDRCPCERCSGSGDHT